MLMAAPILSLTSSLLTDTEGTRDEGHESVVGT